MKDLTTTPTAELLAEWGKLTEIAKHPNYARDFNFDKKIFEGKIAAIAGELDRRCEDAGIEMHVDGMASFSKFGDKTDDMVCPRIYATELRDLLTWLLMKGGNG